MRQGWSMLGALALALVVGACGGKTEGDDEDDASNRSPAPASTSQQPGSPKGQGDTSLGPCMPGFDPDDEPMRPCDWLADGLCYDSKIAACSCVCPRDRKDSTCSSGFYAPNGRTKVSCD